MKKSIRGSFIRTALVLSTFSMVFASCDDLLDVESQHIVNEENKWKDINDVRASLVGVYGLLRSALAENNAQWVYGELRSGDFVSSNRRDLQMVIDGELKASYPLVSNLSNWRKFYAVINAANLFIENSEKVLAEDPQYTELNHKIDVAQARAIKGFTYFLMARIWGEVPIWNKSYEGSFPKIAKSSEEAVLAYAENELKSALNVLPYRYGVRTDEIYPTTLYHGFDYLKWDGVLFNRVSVNAILAHLTAWSGKYFESSVYSEFVLNNMTKSNANYVLTSDLTKGNGFFYTSTNSQLVAFPFKWNSLESTFQGHIEDLTLASPLVPKPIPDIYIPADKIVQIFDEVGDARFHITTNGDVITSYFTDFGGIRPIFSKIKVIRDGTSSDGSFPLYSSAIVFTRIEDIALLRAEALAALGENDLARDILSQIRKSRGLNEVSSSKDLIDEIFEERRKELMGEGWRWFDLIRYNKIKRNNAAFNALIDNKGIYWPVASEVLSNNNVVEQNPYWK